MRGKEFAEGYPGSRIRVVGNDGDLPNNNFRPYGRIVGYKHNEKHSVVVEFEDENDRAHSWNIMDDNVILTVPLESFTGTPMGWSVNVDSLEFATGMFKSSKKKDLKKKAVVVIAYPHTCRVCKSPARNGKENIFCSNVHCKTHSKIARLAGPKMKIHVIRCPKCNEKGIGSSNVKDMDGKIKQNLSCQKGHRWTYEAQPNDVLTKSLAGGQDVIWIPLVGWAPY